MLLVLLDYILLFFSWTYPFVFVFALDTESIFLTATYFLGAIHYLDDVNFVELDEFWFSFIFFIAIVETSSERDIPDMSKPRSPWV